MLEIPVLLIFTKSFWVIFFLLCIFIYLKFVVNGYWRRKGIPYEAPYVLLGNALPLLLKQTSQGDLITQIAEKFRKHPFFGIYIFHKPLLVINDLDTVRTILIRKFPQFPDRGSYHNEEKDPLTNNLFFLPGKKWKLLREKLSPSFTSGKLKLMLPLIQETGVELVKFCNEILEKGSIVDVRNVTGRYTLDTICSIAYGFKSNSFRNSENEFLRHGESVFYIGEIKAALCMFAPKLIDIFGILVFSKKATDFFVSAFEQAVKSRRQNGVDRKDFLNLLIQLMDKGVVEGDEGENQIEGNDADDDNRLSFRQALGQPFVFLAGGFETTSSTLCYCLYELAMYPEVQVKLQEEIDEFMNKQEELSYDVISNQMEYLDMVFSETLRKHPSFAVLVRKCTEDFDIPFSNSRIEKGCGVLIPVKAIHFNPDIYPDPEKFEPLRFTKENISTRDVCAYLPFGTGPRHCIGNRFAILQIKVALIYLLSKFQFSICDKTQIPMIYSKKAISQVPDGPVYLKMEKRKP